MKNIMGHALSVSHRISQVGRDQQWIVLSLVFVCFIMIKFMIKYFCCFFCCCFILKGGGGGGRWGRRGVFCGGGLGFFFIQKIVLLFTDFPYLFVIYSKTNGR